MILNSSSGIARRIALATAFPSKFVRSPASTVCSLSETLSMSETTFRFVIARLASSQIVNFRCVVISRAPSDRLLTQAVQNPYWIQVFLYLCCDYRHELIFGRVANRLQARAAAEASADPVFSWHFEFSLQTIIPPCAPRCGSYCRERTAKLLKRQMALTPSPKPSKIPGRCSFGSCHACAGRFGCGARALDTTSQRGGRDVHHALLAAVGGGSTEVWGQQGHFQGARRIAGLHGRANTRFSTKYRGRGATCPVDLAARNLRQRRIASIHLQ